MNYVDICSLLQVLELKVGCPVMLMRNMSERLVNGLQGTVKHLTFKSATVNFPGIKQTITVHAEKFTRYNPMLGRETATRIQLPLKLSYAMTIHKAQGVSLDFVEVDCSGIFSPGQLAVAVGRAKSTDGLTVRNFDPSIHVLPQPEELLHFVDSPSKSLDPSMKCCNAVNKIEEAADCIVSMQMPDDDEGDPEEDVALEADDHQILQDLEDLAASDGDKSDDSASSSSDLDEGASTQLGKVIVTDVPYVFDAASLVSRQSYSDAETPEQESVNEAVDDTLKRKDLQQIGSIMLAHVHHYWNKHCGGKVSSPKLTAFYSACHCFV